MPVHTQLPDAEFLRLLDGRYDEHRSNKVILAILSALFAFPFPYLLLLALRHDAIPYSRWGADQWTIAALIPFSMVLAVWIFFYIGGEYEFSGSSVTLRRRNVVIAQIEFDDIRSIELSEDHQDHHWLTLSSERKRFIIFLFPKLRAEITKARAQVEEWKKEIRANPER